MANLKLIKAGVTFIAGHGVGMVVRQVITNNTNPKNAYETVFLIVGKFSLGMLIGEAVEDMLDKKMTNAITWLEENELIPVEEPEKTQEDE